MAEDDFTKAADRKTYEEINLPDDKKSLLEDLFIEQKREEVLLRKKQREHWTTDVLKEKRIILSENVRRKYISPLAENRIKRVAMKKIRWRNIAEMNELRNRHEKEKYEIVKCIYSKERQAIAEMRQQRRNDRQIRDNGGLER